MERNVRLVADDPAVMRNWRDVEEITGFEFDHATVIERDRRRSGENEAKVFDRAPRCADTWTDVLAPFPARLISRAANRHPADVHELKFSFLHHPHFIRRLEPFEDHIELMMITLIS
jgi:hypothetical protein